MTSSISSATSGSSLASQMIKQTTNKPAQAKNYGGHQAGGASTSGTGTGPASTNSAVRGQVVNMLV